MIIEEELYNKMPENLRNLFIKINDGCNDEVEKIFPDIKSGGTRKAGKNKLSSNIRFNASKEILPTNKIKSSDGSASRFFYCAKTSKSDRGENNNHPTVKPTKLMRYLVKLITPKDGVCLDPFMGSGSTGKACKIENFDFIGIDLDSDYVKIAENRIETTNTISKLF